MRLDPEQLRDSLRCPAPRRLPEEDLRPAAVLVPLFRRDGQDWVLLTRRTEKLPHHRGEISFPGGARDDADGDRTVTALRETEEELGIEPGQVELLGCLDECISVHGYHVLPVVGVLASPGPYRVNPAEIAEVIELPLRAFFDPGVYHRENWRHRGRLHPVDFYTIERHEVWGLTAAILRNLFSRAGLM